MNYKVDKIDNQTVEILIEGEWSKYEKQAIDEVKLSAELPGFRKGHITEDILKSKFARTISNKVLDKFILDKYPEIINKEDLNVLAQPTVTDIKEQEGKISVKLSVPVFPEVEIKKYKGLGFTKEDYEISDEDISNALLYIANKHSKVKSADDREAQMGDLVSIDFKGFIGEKEFPGGSSEDYQLRLGSNSFIDTFEEQIVGHKKGDEFEVNVSFPEDYAEASLKGAKATFKVKLKHIQDIMAPEIDDDLAKSEGFTNLDELKTYISKKLTEGRERDVNERLFNQIIEKIASNSKVEAPDILIEREMKNKLEQFSKKYKREPNEEEAKLIRSNVIAELKEMLVMREILKKENIEATLDEVKAHIAENFNMKYEDVVSSENSSRFIAEIESNLKIDKLKKFIISNNT